jgi:hypothetical protein
MKFFIPVIIFLAIFSSCKKDALNSDFEQSKKVWQAFKKSANNNYSYTVKTASWAGFGDSTIIFVSNGIVSGRKYTSYIMDGGTGQTSTRETWTENSTNLNTHQSGASTINLDAVYEKAVNDWLKADKKQNTIYFEAKNQGMISTCGYVPNGCQDDCFTGIKISNIKSMPSNNTK